MTAPPGPDSSCWFGAIQAFPQGDHAFTENILGNLLSTGISGLRISIDVDAWDEQATAWFDWLIPQVAGTTALLPCLEGRFARIEDFVERYGCHFDDVELRAAEVMPAELRDRKLGFVLSCPADTQRVSRLAETGILQHVRALGVHLPKLRQNWASELSAIRQILAQNNAAVEVWITDTGVAGGHPEERGTIQDFLDLTAAGIDRFYWTGRPDAIASLVGRNGQLNLLGRLLRDGGVAKLREVADLARPAIARDLNPILIVGGAGFIGSNLADSLMQDGKHVLVLDSLARPGVETNLAWLRERYPQRLSASLGDIRDDAAIQAAMEDAGAVYHLGAQVAVTTSLTDPLDDFSVNAEGTLKLLEAARRKKGRTPLIFSSTNKVYGGLEHLDMMTLGDCYFPVDGELRAHGVGENASLDFCTPYGCSKGVADQYVLDYAKSYGMPTAVLRMSCIYGPRQFGTEDQGWVAHFLLRAMKGEPITVYGDGMQVRDILHVRDAVAAYRGLLDSIDSVKGRAFNLGGGPANAVSLRMVLQEIEQITGRKADIRHAEWRTGDQLYFVSDTRKLEQQLGWHAHVGWREGLRDLAAWIGSLTGAMHTQPDEPERLRA